MERVRVALVTPFVWSQPHDVNEHVAALAANCDSAATR